MKKLFKLSEKDSALMESIHVSDISENEKRFFDTMLHKQQYESAFSNELLVYEKENEEGIYIVRKYFDTYLIGIKKDNISIGAVETISLSDMLSTTISAVADNGDVRTIWQWLRTLDFSCVNYNRNYDID